MADEQTLDSLLERSSGTDVPLLLKAKEDMKRRIKDDPSSANLVALERVTQMLRDAMSNQNGNTNFDKVADILDYLQEQGRKVSRAQLYKDIKLGFVRRQKDGSFARRDVDQYAVTLPVFALPEKQVDEMSDLARRELQEKVAKLHEQRLSIAFDRKVKEGKYIVREDVALELASRASILDVGLRSIFRLHAPDYIRLVGGDTSKTDALAAEFDKNLDAALTAYSRPMEFEFKVEYDPEDPTDTGQPAENDDPDVS